MPRLKYKVGPSQWRHQKYLSYRTIVFSELFTPGWTNFVHEFLSQLVQQDTLWGLLVDTKWISPNSWVVTLQLTHWNTSMNLRKIQPFRFAIALPGKLERWWQTKGHLLVVLAHTLPSWLPFGLSSDSWVCILPPGNKEKNDISLYKL